MIYEIFNALAQDGLTFGEWFGGVILSLYFLHILAFVLSGLAMWGYSYVYDGEKQLPILYNEALKKIFWEKGVVREVIEGLPRLPFTMNSGSCWPEEGQDLADGWYTSNGNSFWNYYQVKDGKAVSHTDTDPLWNKRAALKLKNNTPFLEEFWLFPILPALPLVLACIGVFADYQPAIAASIAAVYLTLRTARGLVRTTKKTDKRLTTLETKA